MRLSDNEQPTCLATIHDAEGQMLSHFDGRHDRTINGVYVVEWQAKKAQAVFLTDDPAFFEFSADYYIFSECYTGDR